MKIEEIEETEMDATVRFGQREKSVLEAMRDHGTYAPGQGVYLTYQNYGKLIAETEMRYKSENLHHGVNPGSISNTRKSLGRKGYHIKEVSTGTPPQKTLKITDKTVITAWVEELIADGTIEEADGQDYIESLE